MTNVSETLEFDLNGLDRPAWSERVEEIADEYGHFEPLGPDFSALQIDAGRQLVVCFETIPSIRKFNDEDAPLGWVLSRDYGWSSLTLLAEEKESWFRHPAIYGFFDRLIDDGFFDDFDRVLFFGAGGGGYAAAAYSVAAPECHVLALRPQATLDPRIARWDRRHLRQRSKDFTSRFGYAPMMLETAEMAWVIHDPTVPEDAMHASLFEAPNTTLLSVPYLGPTIEKDFSMMGIMPGLIRAAMDGSLNAGTFGRMARARRNHLPYLRGLFHRLDAAERDGLLERLCRFATQSANRPMFAKRLEELQSARVRETEDA